MDYVATLMKDNRVKISISKKGLDVGRVRKIVEEKLIGTESYNELKTRIIVYSKPVNNFKLAIPNYPLSFIAFYNILGLGLSVEGMKEVHDFLDGKIEELRE